MTLPKFNWQAHHADILYYEITPIYIPVYWIRFPDGMMFVITSDSKYSPRIHRFINNEQYSKKFTNNNPFVDINLEQQQQQQQQQQQRNTMVAKRFHKNNMAGFDTTTSWPLNDTEQ